MEAKQEHRNTGDGSDVDVNSAASHRSSDLGQLSHHSNQVVPEVEQIHGTSSSNVLSSMLFSDKIDDNDDEPVDGLGLGSGN